MFNFKNKLRNLPGVKQLFGAAGLLYGLWSVNNTRKWSGKDDPPGRRSSSIVDACLAAIVDAMLSCRLVVLDENDNEVPHEILEWIDRDFISAVLRNGGYSGNGIALINENPMLRAQGLSVLASTQVDINRKGGAVDGENVYEFTDITGSRVTYTQDQIFHYKYHIDPDRPWIGRSPLANVDNDILLDARVTAYSSGFMKRFGIPGWLIMPKFGRIFGEKERKALQDDITEHIQGENAGGAAVSPQEVEIKQLAGPRQFIDLGEVRTQPEFRVCAQFQVPPVLAGIQAGYRFTTANATMKEIRRQFADATVKPLMDNFADAINKQVLPRTLFSDGLRVEFAYKESYLFARDIDAEAARLAIIGPIITVNEGRELVGFPPLTDGRGEEFMTTYGQQQNQETEPQQGASNQLM